MGKLVHICIDSLLLVDVFAGVLGLDPSVKMFSSRLTLLLDTKPQILEGFRPVVSPFEVLTERCT